MRWKQQQPSVSDSNIEEKTEKQNKDDVNEEQNNDKHNNEDYGPLITKLAEESIILAKQALIKATTILTRKRRGT